MSELNGNSEASFQAANKSRRDAGGRWQRGIPSPNPGGRPSLHGRIEQWIAKLADHIAPGESLCYAERAAHAAWLAAVAGDSRMARLCFDRVEPAVTVVADVTDRLSRDEQLETIAEHSRSALLRWATADGLILEN